MISDNNSYLFHVFKDNPGVKVDEDFSPILSLGYGKFKLKLFCPAGDTYLITIPVVDDAINRKVDVLAYSNQFQELTVEAAKYAKAMGIIVAEYTTVIDRIESGHEIA